MNFMVGDRVVINDKCQGYKDLIGKHGTIADVANGICRVMLDNGEAFWITDIVVSYEDDVMNALSYIKDCLHKSVKRRVHLSDVLRKASTVTKISSI